MFISIIIPHFNSSKSLIRLLKSIPKDRDIEILVIDDQSNTEELNGIYISTEYKYIKLLKNNKEKSAGSCRNIGLKAAKGKWILFADADDFFVRDAFDILKKFENSEKDIIFFKPISCYSDTLLPAERHKIFGNLIDKYLEDKSIEKLEDIKYKFIVPWSKLIRKSLIDKNKIFFDEVLASNDIMFSLKSSFKSKEIEISDEVIYCVTVHKGSLTMNMNKKIFYSRADVHQRKNIYLKEIGKKKYITPGLSLLVLGKRNGIKTFLYSIKIVLKNIPYIFNEYKEWITNIKTVIRANTNEKKYYIRK